MTPRARSHWSILRGAQLSGPPPNGPSPTPPAAQSRPATSARSGQPCSRRPVRRSGPPRAPPARNTQNPNRRYKCMDKRGSGFAIAEKKEEVSFQIPGETSMAEASAAHRNFHGKAEFPGEAETSLDVFFGFLDEGVASPESSCGSGDGFEDPGRRGGRRVVQCRREQSILGATLYRTSSIESRIRQATKECLMELNWNDSQCDCLKSAAGGCRSCLRRDICDRLRRNGFNCAICKSKWGSSPAIPSGEHTYLEVVDESSSKKGAVRVIIELNFRAEFEMARACEGYNRLVSRLPEVFVGKAERLRPLIKALCAAAKRCTKEKGIHMGPWRKHKYMQAKWLGTCDHSTLSPLLAGLSVRRPKPRASMLTFDMLEKLPKLQCTAVEVV
ncbi:hypothetical protein NL676_000905 [Syzygium grande]|nr:hypothetical protein NL676_000905 [Syzygium grande]